MTKLNHQSFRQSDVPYDHWSRRTDLSLPGRPLSPMRQKRHQPQVSSGCTVGRFVSGVTSSRGLSCPQGSQTREAPPRRLQKASQRLNESSNKPGVRLDSTRLGTLQTHHCRSCNMPVWGPRVQKRASMLSVARNSGVNRPDKHAEPRGVITSIYTHRRFHPQGLPLQASRRLQK